MKVFAERLKELRQEKELSQSELAKKIGVSDVAICYWENEQRSPVIEHLYTLAVFFNVTSDYLLGLEN